MKKSEKRGKMQTRQRNGVDSWEQGNVDGWDGGGDNIKYNKRRKTIRKQIRIFISTKIIMILQRV